MAEEALAARSHQHGHAQRHEFGERRHELKIVSDRLAEPDARVDVDLRHAGGSGRRRRGLEELPDLPDDVGVLRVELHDGGIALAVHRDEPGSVRGCDVRQAG